MMNEKLYYNFTALDNLMDRLWENKLTPGKSNSLPPELGSSAVLSTLCNHQIELLLGNILF